MEFNDFLIGEAFESDMCSTTYEAYDKVKKCWCYLVVPNIKTSWEFQVIY